MLNFLLRLKYFAPDFNSDIEKRALPILLL